MIASRRRHLGDAQTHAMIAQGISAGLSTTAVIYTLAAADPEPVTKAILAIAGVAVQILAPMFSGCGATCVKATQIVDQIEPKLKEIRDAYLGSGARTAKMQASALQVVDALLSDVQAGCSDPALGEAGRKCISERLVHGGNAPWCPTGSGCDWITLYRDPIANDRGVQVSAAQQFAATVTADPLVWLSAAVILWAIAS